MSPADDGAGGRVQAAEHRDRDRAECEQAGHVADAAGGEAHEERPADRGQRACHRPRGRRHPAEPDAHQRGRLGVRRGRAHRHAPVRARERERRRRPSARARRRPPRCAPAGSAAPRKWVVVRSPTVRRTAAGRSRPARTSAVPSRMLSAIVMIASASTPRRALAQRAHEGEVESPRRPSAQTTAAAPIAPKKPERLVPLRHEERAEHHERRVREVDDVRRLEDDARSPSRSAP